MVLQETPYELTTTFASLAGEGSYGHLAGTVKKKNHALGVHLTYLRSAALEGRDDLGNKTGTFRSQDLSSGVSYGARVGEWLSVGVTAKAARETIQDERSSAAWGADAGLSVAVKGALIGLAVNNVGSKMKFGSESDNLPTSYNAGAAMDLGNVTVTAGAGWWANEEESYANLGVEHRLGPVSLRAGYRRETGDNLALRAQGTWHRILNGITGGLGLRQENWTLDYAVAPTSVEYGLSHRMAITFLWGGLDSNRWK